MYPHDENFTVSATDIQFCNTLYLLAKIGNFTTNITAADSCDPKIVIPNQNSIPTNFNHNDCPFIVFEWLISDWCSNNFSFNQNMTFLHFDDSSAIRYSGVPHVVAFVLSLFWMIAM